MSIIEMLQFPFMIRAIAAGVILGWLLATTGVFVTLRKQAFFADGIAHASLLGVAIGLLFGQGIILWAVTIAIMVALAVTFLQKKVQVEHDSAIGVMYSVFFAAAICILYLFPSFRPELSTYLFGSMLTISWAEVMAIGILAMIVIVVLKKYYQALVFMIFDSDGAQIRGVPITLFEYGINCIVAVTIIMAIKLVGVVLVTGLLVIPAVLVRLYARSFQDMIIWSGVVGIVSVVGGILVSFFFNLPTGAAIVLFSGGLFIAALILRSVITGK